jgi:WD40 repeat protein
VIGVGFDPTGREVRTVAADGSAATWDARTGEARARHDPLFVDRVDTSTAVVLPADGRWVLTVWAQSDRHPIQRQATLWDAVTGRREFTREVAGPVHELLPVPVGNLVVCRYAVDGGHQVQTWNAATGAVLATVGRVFEPNYTRYVVTPDGRSLVAYDTESIAGYDLRTGRERFRWKPADCGVFGQPPAPDKRTTSVRAVGASPDGKVLAVSVAGLWSVDVSGWTDNLVLVEAETGAVIRRGPAVETSAWWPAHSPEWLVFSPDGRYVAGPRCVWAVETLTDVRRFPTRPEATAAAFSPDGKRVATGHVNGTAVVWKVKPE